jgi:mycothiol synthase
MTIHMRPYAGAADIEPILALKRICTTAQNMYDAPTVSDLRALLAPLTPDPTTTRPPWEAAQGTVKRHLDRRAMTQRATALWEEADGRLLAYALFAFPGTNLTFQVHPQAQGSGLETAILAWATGRMQGGAQARGKRLSLWCRCHESETERRALLERAGFNPLPAEDMRLVCSLDTQLPTPSLPPGFVLRHGVHGEEELEQYLGLHRAVFDGISMGLDYHQSPAYQPDLDLIAVDAEGTFAAFCLCELHQVADSSGEYTVGEIGVIGTRPTQRKLGLGRTLLLTGMRLLQERGAMSVFLETELANAAALHLFTSVGFRIVSTWQWMTKEIAPTK